MKMTKIDAKWFSELSGEDYDEVYQISDADVDGDHEFCGDYVSVYHAVNGEWAFAGGDRIWWFSTRPEVVRFAKAFGYEVPDAA